jgi:dUTP pyrophosphatase
MDLHIKPLSPKIGSEIPVPYYATPGSAAMDLHACLDKPVELLPHQSAVIPTGIAIALPSIDFVALVFARSGLSVRHGISLSNGVGVIDSDYRGEVLVGLTNHSDAPYIINSGDRIAQLCVMPVTKAEVHLCDVLEETDRGAGGFGSTGK